MTQNSSPIPIINIKIDTNTAINTPESDIVAEIIANIITITNNDNRKFDIPQRVQARKRAQQTLDPVDNLIANALQPETNSNSSSNNSGRANYKKWKMTKRHSGKSSKPLELASPHIHPANGIVYKEADKAEAFAGPEDDID